MCSNLIHTLAVFMIASCFLTAQELPENPRRFPGKFGVFAGADLVDFSNSQNPAIFYKRQDIIAPTIGVNYKFEDFKFLVGLNLNIGFKIRNFSTRDKIFIPAEELGIPNDIKILSSFGPNWTYHLPIDLKYTFNQNSRTQFFVGSGFEFQHYGFTSGSFSENTLNVGGITRISTTYRERQNSLTNGINFMTGLNLIGPGGSKFQLEIKYHRHFQTMEKSSITAINLELSPETRSDHNWTGHYTSITLTYFPSFKFNNPSRK